MNASTEAAAIAELAQDANDARRCVIQSGLDDGALPVYQTVIRDSERVHAATHEQMMVEPFRQRGTTRVSSVDSFCILTNRLGNSSSVAFADEAGTVTTVINYQSGWGDHRVYYAPKVTPEWKSWSAADGRMMPQREFAEMLQDLRHTIVDPTAADVMQIARTFSATRTAQFESGVRLDSGDVQFAFVQETRAKSGPKGGTVEVPEEIVISCPVFRDSPDPSTVTMEFRYDASSSGLLLGYRIIQREDVVASAWSSLVEVCRSDLAGEIALIDGPAPSAIDPMS